jgi:hypothetical protein
MAQILPEVPSFSTLLARNLGAGVSQGIGQAGDFAQKLLLEKAKAKSLAHETKHLEKVKMIETGLGTIQQMRSKLQHAGSWTSNPKSKWQSLLPGETQKARSELESLGLSLIQLRTAGLRITNQKEFDKLTKTITDPNSSPSEIDGALNGIESILQRSLGTEGSEEKSSTTSPKKPKFSQSNPEHEKKARQLYKTFNDKNRVKEELSKEFEF